MRCALRRAGATDLVSNVLVLDGKVEVVGGLVARLEPVLVAVLDQGVE